MGQDPREGYGAREGLAPRATEDDDVEGHGLAPREGYAPRATEDDDVEGHSMLPMDVGSARQLANARESEIRRNLAHHDLETEARRPHNKQTK